MKFGPRVTHANVKSPAVLMHNVHEVSFKLVYYRLFVIEYDSGQSCKDAQGKVGHGIPCP